MYGVSPDSSNSLQSAGKSMKKILIIATTPLQHDGLTRVILETIERADRSRAQLFLVPGMGFAPGFEQKIKEKGVVCLPVPDRAGRLPFYIAALLRIMNREQFDTVHIHGNSATMAFDLVPAVLAGIPIRVAHVHNTVTNHPALHAILKPLLNMLVTDPAACSSPAGKWLYKKKFTVVKNGINPEEFAFDPEARARVREKLGIEDAFVVGHVGRFTRQKNHDFLLDIFARIVEMRPDAVLLLVGEGELMPAVKEKAKKLGLLSKVIFYGTTDSVSDLYMAMDVFLLPSLYEGLGIAAVEAQAAGLPAVLSGEVPEEAAFEENVLHLPLSAGPESWAKAALARDITDRPDRRADVMRAGYDIKDMENTLETLWHLPKKRPDGMKISVVMAVYNGKKYLKEQLDSIREQTNLPDEVIISDDGSTDGTPELISSYIKEHGLEGWRLVRQKGSLGVGGNYAAALKGATGDLIFLADQDDLWLPDKIERMAAAFSDPDTMLAVSSIRYMDAAGNEMRIKTQLSNRKDHKISLRESFAVCSYLGMSMAMRRKIPEQADRTLWEQSSHDWALLLEAHSMGNVVFLGHPGQFYRQHEGNASGIRGGDRLENRLELVRRQKRHVSAAAAFSRNEAVRAEAKEAERFLAAREKALLAGSPVRFARMFFLYRSRRCTLRTFIGDVFASLSCQKNRYVV